ncbi:MAG: hypothetical protein ACRCYY_09095 [Trueperaceae bacterium]
MTSDAAWLGRERRGHAALNRLARQLYHVCRNATDPLELAAQLESLGYNHYRVEREFGLTSTFELAEHLFAITPRRPHLIVPQHSVRTPLWWQVPTCFAFVVTVALYYVFQLPPPLPLFSWLLAWSLGGSYLLRSLAGSQVQQRGFRIMLVMGFLGVIGSLWFSNRDSFETQHILLHTILGLLWWQLPATFWSLPLSVSSAKFLKHFIVPLPLRHVLVVALALGAFALPFSISLFMVSVASLVLLAPWFLPRKTSRKQKKMRLPSSSWKTFAFPALLGLGQSLLLSHLVASSSYPLSTFIIAAVTLLVTNWLETSLKLSIADALWFAKSNEEFQVRVFRSLDFFLHLLSIILFVGILLFLSYLLPLHETPLHLVLFNLALGLSFLLLGFQGVVFPACVFSIASLCVLIGLPFLLVVIALTAILGIGVVLYILKIERYGVSLL